MIGLWVCFYLFYQDDEQAKAGNQSMLAGYSVFYRV